MAESARLKTHVNRGLAWIGAASSVIAVLDIVSTVIVLAHWVSRAEYGIANLAVTLFPVLDLATDLGVTSAVIQRDDHSVERISTVFWLNLLQSLIMFAGLAALAPLLGRFQEEPLVGTMLIVYGGKLIWQNVYAIPSALMKKELRFMELSVIRVCANLAEFIGKIGFAAAGFGVWCFVLGPLCRVIVTGVGVQLRHPWRPRLHFRPRQAWDYAWYGMRTSASQILFYLYTNIDYQVVGYYFGKSAVGLYTLAYQIVLEPVRVISNVVVDVAFPTFARLRRTRSHLVEQFVAFTRMNLVTVLPFLALIFLVAEEFIQLVVGHEWTPAATATRILCLVGVLRAMSFIVPPLLDGIGRPGLTLIYTTVASIVLPTLFVVFAKVFGPDVGYLSVAWAWAVGYPVAFVVLALIALNQIGMGGFEYLRVTIGIPACTAAATLLGWGVHHLLLGTPTLVRFVVTSATVLGATGVLLAYFQGISPRSIIRSLSHD